MSKLRADVLAAWRALAARPGAVGGAAIVLGVGLGLIGTLFAAADPFALAPLPYPRPSELAIVTAGGNGAETLQAILANSAGSRQWGGGPFPEVAGYWYLGAWRVKAADGVRVLQVAGVTPSFFYILGVGGVGLGDLTGLEATGGRAMALTGDAYRRLFQRNAAIVGVSVERSDASSVRVAAVLRDGFVFPSDRTMSRVDALVVVRPPSVRSSSMPPSAVLVRSAASPEAIQRSLATAAAAAGSTGDVTVEALSVYMTKRVRALALGALLVGGLVLLNCAAHAASLLFVRIVYRGNELRVRYAMGATSWDLARLVLVDVLMLAVGALLVGTLVASGLIGAARRLMPAEYLILGAPALTGRVVTCLVLGCAAVTGVAALAVLVVNRRLLRSPGGAQDWPNATGRRFPRVAVVAGQCALTGFLLVQAAFLARSYVALMTQRSGFAEDAFVITASYPDGEVGVALQRDVDATLKALERIPGLSKVGAATGPLVNNMILRGGLVVGNRVLSAVPKAVSAGFFQAAGVKVVAGREFLPGDADGTAVLVSESLARVAWPSGSAIGEAVSGRPPRHVVGVVADTFDVALDMPPVPTVYSLLRNPAGCQGDCNDVHYVMRITGARRKDIESQAVRVPGRVSRDAVIVESGSLGSRLAGSVRDRTFATLTLVSLAVTAIGISATGVAMLVAFVAARRTRELAIRAALGARGNHLLSVVLGETTVAVTAGLCLGTVTGGWLSAGLSGLVYGVAPADPWTVAAAAAILLVVALPAALIPALRAVRLSPAAVLRAI